MYERFTGVKSFNPVFNKFSQIVKKCIFKAELVKPRKIFWEQKDIRVLLVKALNGMLNKIKNI